mgnify:FL=1
MSLTHCALSGEPLIEPMVSKKTGHVYERSTILKHIDKTGRCPITNTELTQEDLLPLQVSTQVKPKAFSATSIPDMIKAFQDEWDSQVLETTKLKQHIQQLRLELSHALYQHDAACRVIARLLREKEELLHALHGLSSEHK